MNPSGVIYKKKQIISKEETLHCGQEANDCDKNCKETETILVNDNSRYLNVGKKEFFCLSCCHYLKLCPAHLIPLPSFANGKKTNGIFH